MDYSVYASAVFAGQPVHETLPIIRAAGYTAYEFWSWWDQDVAALVEAQSREGLKAAALCTRFASLNQPQTRGDYLSGLRESISVARRLGAPVLISQVGQALEGVPRAAQHEQIARGLKACAPMLEDAGVTLAIEPPNTRIDHVGYYLWQAREAFDLVEEVGSPRVKVLYDMYHQHIMEGSPIEEITANLDKIAHFHLAGYPGRHEPMAADDEVNAKETLRAIERAGYRGRIGLEYVTRRDPLESLRSVKSMLP